ncbi:MAG: hybrid sensor histidine kinase/response regulator [Alphaproteobacteria bacterium BRH_c36]|nr:MAG: hybrid sensor histidine kinase/response regulator [Alphaproteobacteria bacterium BRH_c36]
MFDGTTIIIIALGYVSALFVLAWLGDRMLTVSSTMGRPLIYALSLATYCTSWTFFGSVGLAAGTGFDFVPVYLGPILMFTVGLPLLSRIVRLAKGQNSSSVADFLAARYGKSQAVAALVTLVTVVGVLPYLALQLKAVSASIEVILGGGQLVPIELPRIGFADTAFLITIAMIVFAILFGTRHVDATEHQEGLMLAVAAESLVKLMAFLAVGIFIVMTWNGGPQGLYQQVQATPPVAELFSQPFHGGTWLTVTFLSFVCAILLPRQFHVAVVENNSQDELRRAAWIFPLYLVLINLLVVPIAAAGLLAFADGSVAPDMFVMKLPVDSGVEWVSMTAFIGGLSAATAMVIVESIALAIMVSNGVVVPLILRNRVADYVAQEDMAGLLLMIRRVAIIVVMLLAYGVFAALGDAQILSTIGLISFAAIAQLAPAFFLGLFWKQGNARGALAGLAVGFAIWSYTLLLPWIVKAGWIPNDILLNGPLGLRMLRPEELFYLNFEPLTHGVLWSVCLNMATYIAVSIFHTPAPIERLQAHAFVDDDRRPPLPQPTFRLWRSSITVNDMQETVARYLGRERAERSFHEYAASRGIVLRPDGEADLQLVRFAEHLLASSIGAASSRLVLSLLLRRENMTGKNAMQLLDDASEALQYNRDLLQSALDQVRHGLSVFDKDMRLICWNRQFRMILGLPPELARVGAPLDRILRAQAERGDFGPGDTEEQVADRLLRLAVTKETFQEQLAGERIIEVRTSPMPQGGIVTTFSDITDRVAAASALARANENLERRVRERTAELLDLNAALEQAKSKADEANLDKTRFLAAASHDVLQPLNAARLYATSLMERPLDGASSNLIRNVDASLNAVEEIFSALIDISRMDAGRLTFDIEPVSLAELFENLHVDFAPAAREKGLDLRIVPTSLWVHSDRRLLRRVLQNFVSNAIKYTRSGRVLLGARRKGGSVAIEVFDTGPGIPEDKREFIFREFQRLEGAGSTVSGLGLGLSIVERICRILDHPIGLVSEAGRGSAFSILAPLAEARPRAASALAPRPQIGTLEGIRIICIDNEPAILAGMQSLLTGWNCNVRTAASTAEALRKFSAGGPIDIILADYHLDLGTGLDAIHALRKAAAVPLPAIVITADHTPEVERLIRDSDVGLLRKPLKAAALRALMTRFLHSRRAAAE